MSDDEQAVDEQAIIEAAALMSGLSVRDDRLKPLAADAIKLLLDSNDSLMALLQSYMQTKNAPQPVTHAVRGMKNKNTDQLLAELAALIKAN